MDYSQPLVFPDSKDEELEKKLKAEQQKMEEKRRKEDVNILNIPF